MKNTDSLHVLKRHTAYDVEFRRTSIVAWRFLSFISEFCFASFLREFSRQPVETRPVEKRSHVNEDVKRREYRLLGDLGQLAAEFAWLLAVGGVVHEVAIIATIAVSVAAVSVCAVEFELRAVGCRRVAVG